LIVAIVPARGGSKRIPRKNIVPLAGKPLLAHTIDAALAALDPASVFVSTDDPEIAALARGMGVQVITRPAEHASDSASTEAVLLHALGDPRVAALRPGWLMTLPPTSPLRDGATIARFMADFERDGRRADCYFSVSEDRGDYWQRKPDGRWERLFPGAPRRQQDREPLYEENSAIYLTRGDALKETGSILGRTACGVPIARDAAMDINEQADIDYVQWLLQRARA
jgi:CMP-N,N'-diacetyllegionaminic acid synthase